MYRCYRFNPGLGEIAPSWFEPGETYAVFTVPDGEKIASATSIDELRLKLELMGVAGLEVCPRGWALVWTCAGVGQYETDEAYGG